MDVATGVAVMAGDIAALEPAIQNRCVSIRIVQDSEHVFRQFRISAGAVSRAEIEIGQPAFEESGQDRSDGMGIEQQHPAELVMDVADHLRQFRMIRVPVGIQAVRDFRLVRLLPRLVYQLLMKCLNLSMFYMVICL